MTSTPFLNVTPWMTLGNWFSPLSLRQVLAAAKTSLKTMRRAVSCDSAPLVRTVRCRTVANTLSIGFAVRRCSQCSAGTSWKVSSAPRSFARHATAFSYLAPYFPAKVATAASAVARSGAVQISRRSALAAGWTGLGHCPRRHLVENVGGLVHGAALVARRGVDLLERRPEA